MALAMRSLQGGRTTRDVVLISAIWLALAGLIGLFAALLGSRRAQSRVPAPSPPLAPAQDGKRPRSVWFGLGCLVFAGVCAGGLLFAYTRLNHARVTADLTATANNLGPGQLLILTDPGRGSGVRWMMTPADVGQLTVEGPGPGQAEVMLPLDRSLCSTVAATLKVVRCEGGTIVSPDSPVEFAWSSPQQLDSMPVSQVSASLDIQSSAAADGSVSLTMTPQTTNIPSLCFESPLSPAKLTVSVGQHSFPHPFSGNQIVNCGQGIPVLIGSPGAAPPAFELDRVSGLKLTAYGSAGTLQGFTGQIMLNPGGMTVPGSSSIISLRSRAAMGLTTTFVVPGTTTFTAGAPAASSVMTDGGQLVPTVWSQQSDVLVPVMGGIASLVVATPLGVSWKVLVDAASRRRGRRN
jgi:hypothetical protein